MAAWLAPAIAALGSFFGGKSERSAANDARRQQEALVRQMLADAEAAYGPEAAQAAVQKGLEDVARQQAAAQMGMERNLYARGMGERTPGARAQAEEAGLLGRLQTRQNIEMEYPMKLQQARAMALGGATQVAQQAEERAGAATALPFDLLGLYQASTAQSPLSQYLVGQTSGYQVPTMTPKSSGAISQGLGGLGAGFFKPKTLPLPTYKF